MSRTIHPGGTPLPDGATVPEGWTMPMRADDWQRLCVADPQWCRVFKYVFRIKTGINLDALQDVLFPRGLGGSGSGDGIPEFNNPWQLLLYIGPVVLVVGLFIAVVLGYFHLVAWWNTSSRSYSTVFYRKYGSNGRKSDYYRLKSVKSDGMQPLLPQDSSDDFCSKKA